jgi:hypothetical protein
VAKKLKDISKDIDEKSEQFRLHLDHLLDKEVLDFLNHLVVLNEVYVFSGVIRNYFLKITETRDLDLIIDGNIEIEESIKKYTWTKNSFGGYKVKIANINVDLWRLENTWALHYQQSFDFDLAKFIPNTAFFNFSAIVYHLNKKRFFYTIHFLRFLQSKKIDLAFAPNANTALCVVNSLYYSDKFQLKLAPKLVKYIKILYKRENHKYEEVQIKHFGAILYSKAEIKERIESLR